MGPAASALAAACWPGGLTVVVPQRPDVPLPAVLTGGAPTIGLRVPDHDAPRALAAAVGPLPVTSANVSGLPEARDATEILEQLGDAVDLILDGGPAHGGPASTVVDCTGERPRALRAGAIPLERIIAILDEAGVHMRPFGRVEPLVQLFRPRASTRHRSTTRPSRATTYSSTRLTTGQTWFGMTQTTLPIAGRGEPAGSSTTPWWS